MIPERYLEDLKTAPIDKVDFVATFIEVNIHLITNIRLHQIDIL